MGLYQLEVLLFLLLIPGLEFCVVWREPGLVLAKGSLREPLVLVKIFYSFSWYCCTYIIIKIKHFKANLIVKLTHLLPIICRPHCILYNFVYIWWACGFCSTLLGNSWCSYENQNGFSQMVFKGTFTRTGSRVLAKILSLNPFGLNCSYLLI